MKRRINPRGVRKIDLQKARREARKIAHSLYPQDWQRKNAYLMGWEQGAKDAHQAGLARIDEALERGTLRLP